MHRGPTHLPLTMVAKVPSGGVAGHCGGEANGERLGKEGEEGSLLIKTQSESLTICIPAEEKYFAGF